MLRALRNELCARGLPQALGIGGQMESVLEQGSVFAGRFAIEAGGGWL